MGRHNAGNGFYDWKRNFHCFCGYDEKLRSGYWLIAVWVITGIAIIAAALSYGELSRCFKSGGQYTYITEIFGKTSFLYGWGMFTVIQTKIIAAVAVAFGKFFGVSFPALNDAVRFSKSEF